MNNFSDSVSQGGAPPHIPGFPAEPPEEIAVLPLEGVIVFPLMIARIGIADEDDKRIIDEAMDADRMIAVFYPKPPEEDEQEKPAPGNFFKTGTLCNILQTLRVPDGSIRVFLQGVARIRIQKVRQTEPYLRAKVKVISEVEADRNDLEVEAMMKLTMDNLQKAINLGAVSEELAVAALNVDGPGRMADLVASNMPNRSEELMPILEQPDEKKRLRELQHILSREIQVLELGNRINDEVREEVDKSQRSYYLHQQLRAIRKELGETDPQEAELESLERRIAETEMPEHAREVAEREFSRLTMLPTAAAEYSVIRTYLDWILDIPWSLSSDDRIDIAMARKVLDQDHYGLEKVKERILEFLSVIRLKEGDLKGPILCLVGPPGVGKTSLGRSIARATGRKFQNFSLGGIRDEAEIRGHRRTYVGAMPGRIVKALKDSAVNNPLIMLDEVDKLGADFRGDPSSALLEVLDPEQNFHFNDHYMDMPIDLSRVMFITTANTLDTIPDPLRDRMEIIRIAGYTELEKQEIAARYLAPREIENAGLTKKDIAFRKPALRAIIRDYTHEAGVRKLQQEIGKVSRQVAMKVAEYQSYLDQKLEAEFDGRKKSPPVMDPPEKAIITPDNLTDYLGLKRSYREQAERMGRPGVAIGLAWTSVGGEILFVEAARYQGKGQIKLTGQLGDVMKESGQAALTFLRSFYDQLGIDPEMLEQSDFHLHVPAGATPKDGPSAGTAMTTALASLVTGRPVKDYLAMTGEITLRGNVLPVGGIKEKCLAAHRAGIKTVLLPKHNESDYAEVPEVVRKDLKVWYYTQVLDVVKDSLKG